MRGENMANDIYICYSANDKEIAEKICNFLEENNFKCWIAPRDLNSSENYADEISNNIKNSNIMIFIFSENSKKSEFALNEIGTAFSYNKPILVFYKDEIIPEGDMNYILKNQPIIYGMNLNDSVYSSLLSNVNYLISSVSFENDGLSGGVSKHPGHASSSEIYEINDSSIFLSYDEKDLPLISSDISMLKNLGYNLTENLEKSSICLTFITKNSMKAIAGDIEKAFSYDIPVILVYLEDMKIKFGLSTKIKYKSKINDLEEYTIKRYLEDDESYVENYLKFFNEFGI